MSKKLTTAVFLALTLMLIWSLAHATAEEKPQQNIEVRIHELQEQIQELESAFKRASTDKEAAELKAALEDKVKKLDILKDEFPQPKKSKWLFPEIHLGIEQTKGHLAELEHTLEALEDAKPERRETIRQKIAQQEAHLEELAALLEKRTAEREKKLEDKEASIRELKAQIQELEYALERASTDKEAAELKGALNKNINKLEKLMSEFHQPKWEFAELQIAIERNRGHLNGLREVLGVLKETGAGPDMMRSIQVKMKQREEELVELTARLEQRRADTERKKTKERTKLVIISLKHANAVNLSEVIAPFLMPSGVISADPDTNSLVIRDAPAGLETAHMIIRELDVGEKMRERRVQRDRDRPDEERRERRERDRPRRENVITGKVIETGKEGVTIETEEGKATFHVPVRKKEDGISIPFEELSHHVASLKVGSRVKIQWYRGEDRKLWIRRVDTGEPKFITGKVIETGKKGLTLETGEGKVTFYVPLRKREDGTRIPFEELSHHVASLKVGSKVKVQWIRGEDPKKLWIRKVEKVEK